MPDYQKGKIYKIWDSGYNECYIGSTCQELSQRMAGHRRNYDKYKKGMSDGSTSSFLFDEYGVENCKIELLEVFPCTCRTELHAREGFFQRRDECINRYIAGRNRNQWVDDNKEKIREYHKCYYINNQEKLKERATNNREINKEKYQQQDKERYVRQRETRLINRKEKYNCDCGSVVCKGDIAIHKKTNKHQQYLKSTSQEEPREAS